MTDLQSSEAILNDLFSSFEKHIGKKSSKLEDDGTEDEDSDSEESEEEKVVEVSSDNTCTSILWQIYTTRLDINVN